jgi:hypothetical protein
VPSSRVFLSHPRFESMLGSFGFSIGSKFKSASRSKNQISRVYMDMAKNWTQEVCMDLNPALEPDSTGGLKPGQAIGPKGFCSTHRIR